MKDNTIIPDSVQNQTLLEMTIINIGEPRKEIRKSIKEEVLGLNISTIG
jgi:hypothetical protein